MRPISILSNITQKLLDGKMNDIKMVKRKTLVKMHSCSEKYSPIFFSTLSSVINVTKDKYFVQLKYENSYLTEVIRLVQLIFMCQISSGSRSTQKVYCQANKKKETRTGEKMKQNRTDCW